jgi:hypothetical protein
MLSLDSHQRIKCGDIQQEIPCALPVSPILLVKVNVQKRGSLTNLNYGVKESVFEKQMNHSLSARSSDGAQAIIQWIILFALTDWLASEKLAPGDCG